MSSTVLGDDPTPLTPLPAPDEPHPAEPGRAKPAPAAPSPGPTTTPEPTPPPTRSDAETSQAMGPEALSPTMAAAPVTCSDLAVEVRSEPASVAPGKEFIWTLTVSNPNPKGLSRLSVTDTVSATPGIAWHVTLTAPPADSETDSRIAFDNIAPVEAGGSRVVQIRVRVDPTSRGGRFSQDVLAAGDCETGDRVEGTAGVEGHTTLDLPEVTSVLGATAGRSSAAAAAEGAGAGMARTGGPQWGAAALVLLGASAALRRVSRRR